MTSRYRISDQGVLLIFNDNERRWNPIECSFYQHYCYMDCTDFKVDGDTATLKCCKEDMILELED
jgi:hypothetical protein